MFNRHKSLTRIALAAAVVAAIAGGTILLTHGPASHAQSAAATTAAQKNGITGGPVATAIANRPMLIRKALPPAPVQWSPALALSERIRANAKPGSLIARLPRPQLDAIRLPVILPRGTGPIRSAAVKLISFGDAYSMNLPQDEDAAHKGTQITVYGTRTFVPADKGALSMRPIARVANMLEDVRISQMEDGWTATFTRFGVVYSVDVTCDQMGSADCQSDGYIRKAIAEFADVAIGSAAQAEANRVLKPATVTSPSLATTLTKSLNTLLHPTPAKP